MTKVYVSDQLSRLQDAFTKKDSRMKAAEGIITLINK